MIEEKKSQVVFNGMKDDTSSLIVLCDSSSFVTKRTTTTTATSSFSMNFDFDTELLQAKAYKSTLRSLMRRARARGSSDRSGNEQGWYDPTAKALNEQSGQP